MTEVMLVHESKLLTFCLVLFFFLVGCNKYKTYNKEEINEIRARSTIRAKSVIGEREYWKIFEAMNDSVENWKSHNLGYYKYMGLSKDYEIDSVLCFNEKGNKFIATILQRQLLKEGVQDDIWYFYGVKIDNQWNFFSGATLVLPREFYQKDIHTSLSFEKLKQIATDNIYRGYLKKNALGEWKINDDFFGDLTSVAWCTDCATQEDWNNAYMKQVNDNWKQRDK